MLQITSSVLGGLSAAAVVLRGTVPTNIAAPIAAIKLAGGGSFAERFYQ